MEGPFRDMVMREEASSVPTPHLLDESSNGDESSLRKRRIVELGKDVVVNIGRSRIGVSQTAPVPTFTADAILAGRSPQTEGVYLGAGSVHFAEGGASSNVGGGLRVEGEGLGSDVDPEDVREFVGHHNHVEVRVERSDRYIVVLEDYNMLSNFDQVVYSLDLLCATPESKVLRAISNMELSQNVACMALRREDQLACKVEDLRERDEELMKAVARNSELEASLKVKEDELELSRGVMAENVNLQAKVASLTAELGKKVVEIDRLKGELSVSADKLAIAISEMAALENTLHVSRSKLTKEKEASELKVAGLEGRVKELETELSVLNEQVASLRAEDASRHSQPSTSHASVDPVVPHRLYKLWVHAEARLDVYKALH
ncbi:filament-like plant protein 1 [Nicotiana sylvestris]|uniref:filament-like plant protein 1 n=1 Tax=Nicotiana sylvestris TaxID=4096 RepID=UPI00388C6EB4